MIERGQAPSLSAPMPQPLPRRRTVADRAVHLLAAQHELDRPADQPRRHDAEDLRPGHQPLRAEAAAEERAADLDLVRRDAEQPGEPRRASARPWVGMSIVSLSPSHAATIACGSIAL